ncbi:MAG: plasmid replication protein RepC [Paracoccaceae bacterium]
MGYTPVTPFRRAMDAAHLTADRAAAEAPPPGGVNKWEALRELAAARTRFGLSDRDMGVLQALVSFHPQGLLGGNSAQMVVHPSNEALCARLNGMPGSTLRRHLAHLVAAGVIARRDSPNGKRYARIEEGEKVAFGFDLAPLATRFAEFCAEAEAIRAETQALHRLRETVSLMRRDLAGLSAYGAEIRPDMTIWDTFQALAATATRLLRRKLEAGDLAILHDDLSTALIRARGILEPSAEESSINHAENEQHSQNSNTNSHDLELRIEHAKAAGAEPLSDADPAEMPPDDTKLPRMPLGLVLTACPEIQTYADGPIRHWHEFVRAADVVRPMMGISPSAWDDARQAMGPEEAAVVVAAMLQRFDSIQSPGGYLRALTNRALDGAFSSGPMIMALMRRAA